MKEKKSGFVALIGRPSSGKSTLVNNICGYKISIVSKHPQTTRFLVKGIYNDDDSQIIFIDSPGFHNFNSNLNRGLTNLAVRNIQDADLILYLVDLSRDYGSEEDDIIKKLNGCEKKLVVVFNKLDIKKNNSKIREQVLSKLNTDKFIEISSQNGDNIDKLLNLIKNMLQEGPQYYPDDFVTDQTIPFRISEVVREKIFTNTSEEIPHSCYVEVEEFTVNENKIVANALVCVEADSQKGMLIGKNGSMIKKIGTEARIDLEEIFERKVNLFLNVKVNSNWRKNDNLLKRMFDI